MQGCLKSAEHTICIIDLHHILHEIQLKIKVAKTHKKKCNPHTQSHNRIITTADSFQPKPHNNHDNSWIQIHKYFVQKKREVATVIKRGQNLC